MSVNSAREDEVMRDVSKRETLLRLYRYLFAYKKTLAAVALLLLITLAVTLATPLMIELAIDTYVANRDTAGLLRLAVIALLLFVLYMLCTRCWMRMMADVTNKVLLTIRSQLYEHIQTLSFHFFDSRPTGKILARVVGDVNSLKDVLSDSVTKLLPDLLTVIGVACIMLAKSWQLALAALLTLPFLAAGMFLIQISAHKLWQIHRKKNSNLNAFIHENFSGIRIVQSFAAEPERQKDFDRCALEYRDSFVDAVRIGDTFGALVEITWGVGGFLLYFIGIRIVGADKIGVGTFLAFSTYLGMFWSPIRNLSSFYNKIVTNISAAERIFDILDTPAEITSLPGSTELPPIKGEVRFENVSFAYTDEPDKLVLENVSFTVKPGETIALVGPTGAGKTTIVNLISRFYDVTDGKICIDGFDTRKVTLESLRRQMGVMTQDTFLFTGTVRENICYGKSDATEAEMIAAAKAVNAHSFIMEMENGYDTKISERSSQLSIGQRQLLAFARTMLSDPRILILDEATSSIDTHTELLVQSGIAAMLQNRTSFIIAHRLSTIRGADRIFYIDGKHILESGSHAELMERKGAYYRLYQSQFECV
ncbi:MAG: ABC transporter ATP-binding protein [Marvinbryantia sp.]|uniref:ABC transporter ATP-binding protein n=1 Tax=Marvinbryantia sp. TaxID=2496532 RepID=UPI0025E4B907|nr:ABC transporter ATP-binding protein [uncultured Marvinbryantia sp.]